jgi:hypothetical protein
MDMKCPSKSMEERVNPVLKVLNDNKEYTVLDYIEKGGMTLRSGRVLSEPSAKRVKMGGRSKQSRNNNKQSRSKRSRSKQRSRLTGGGNKEVVLDGLASILAACTVTSGFLSMWCSFGPVIGTFVTGVLTKNLEPKCADTFKINGYDTGIGFTRGLSSAMRLITGADSCGTIDEQHNIATVRIEIVIMQLVSMSAFITSLSYQQVKKFWTIILLACINVTEQSVGAVGSFMKNWFSAKVDVTTLKPDFNLLFINNVVKEILKEINADAVEDPVVVKALEKAADILEEKNATIAPEIIQEAQQELNTLNKEASLPPKSRSNSPEPMEVQEPRVGTPRAESMVPNSRPATEEPDDISGGRKKRRTIKKRKGKSHKRTNKKTRSS